jgi:hypothetical protein
LNSNVTGATSGTGTIYPFGSPEFIFVLSGVCVVDSFVFCVVGVYCMWVFLHYFLVVVLYVLRITASDYPLDIFRRFAI